MNQTLIPAKRRKFENKNQPASAEAVQQILREIAFVLHATRKVKRAILLERGDYDRSVWSEPA